jgi:DNA-binding NtrC family response regulator
MASSTVTLPASTTKTTPPDDPTGVPQPVWAVSIAHHPRSEAIGQRKELPTGTAIHLGRDESCMGKGIFKFAHMSRDHANIKAEPEGLVLEDLGSTNGTQVNGVDCKAARLVAGDVLSFGEPVPILLVVHQALSGHANLPHPTLIGTSLALGSVIERIEQVARSPGNVLLRGEMGTGKELVARAIHVASGRLGSYHAVNCAHLKGTIGRSELFGHVKGAFTGADRDHIGIAELAHRGTLFLDEVGDTESELQAGLLRFLEQREVHPVGANRTRVVDVKIVGASNRDFEDMFAKEHFREDMYSRLEESVIHLPPLRERVEDIPALVSHFVREAAGQDVPVELRLMLALMLYGWPRNVRELRSKVRGAVREADGKAPIPLPPAMELELSRRPRCSSGALDGKVQDAPPGHPDHEHDEQQAKQPRKPKPSSGELAQLFARFRGNVRSLAVSLSVSRNTIYEWIRKYGINPDDHRGTTTTTKKKKKKKK